MILSMAHLHAALLLLLTLTDSRCPKPCMSVVSNSLHHRAISLNEGRNCITSYSVTETRAVFVALLRKFVCMDVEQVLVTPPTRSSKGQHVSDPTFVNKKPVWSTAGRETALLSQMSHVIQSNEPLRIGLSCKGVVVSAKQIALRPLLHLHTKVQS